MVLAYYLGALNFLGLFLMAWDKRQAIRHAWRIPEKNLLGAAVLGGSVGVFLGMRLFRHKTLHPKFRYGLPVILLLQLACAWIVFTPK